MTKDHQLTLCQSALELCVEHFNLLGRDECPAETLARAALQELTTNPPDSAGYPMGNGTFIHAVMDPEDGPCLIVTKQTDKPAESA